MSTIKLKIISQEEVAKIFSHNIDGVFEIVEDAFKKHKAGDTLFPDKISQIFDKDTQNRINCMPATLISDQVSGLKWVSVFPSNAAIGKQNITGVMLLSEIKTGFPIAIIDGTLATKLRTAAVGAVAAKYLAPSSVKTIGIIGAGEEARMHLTLLKYLFPSICNCNICARRKESEAKFVEIFKNIMPDVSFNLCNGSSFAAAHSADIIITAISGQAPVLKASDIKDGALYIHVGGWEDEYEVALKASKIVCDDWEASKHRTQTICRMYKEGVLKDDDIYANLGDLIVGEKTGRKDDNEFIYFNSVGLSFIDLNFANYIYKEASRLCLGQEVVLAENDMVNYSDLL